MNIFSRDAISIIDHTVKKYSRLIFMAYLTVLSIVILGHLYRPSQFRIKTVINMYLLIIWCQLSIACDFTVSIVVLKRIVFFFSRVWNCSVLFSLKNVQGMILMLLGETF